MTETSNESPLTELQNLVQQTREEALAAKSIAAKKPKISSPAPPKPDTSQTDLLIQQQLQQRRQRLSLELTPSKPLQQPPTEPVADLPHRLVNSIRKIFRRS